ncbi:MAG TPA: sulfatase [Actinomycetota bacterium]|jgi:arylsulfatase A-like enzyme
MRRTLARIGLALVVLAGPVIAFSGSSEPVAAAQKKPNVVIILTDDQRYDTLWAMPKVQNLLVDHGVQFNQGFVVNSLCCPSRTSILTGDYSHTTGVWRDNPPFGGYPTFSGNGDEESTLATWLHGDGYRTALFGKYLNGYEDAAAAGTIPPGWDSWNAFSRAGYYNYRAFVHNKLRQFGKHPRDYSTEILSDEASSYIQNAKSPFFMYFAPYAPHRPATPSNKYQHRFSHLDPYHPPSYNEGDVSDKPQYIQDQPRIHEKQARAIDRFRQRQYQTLVSADNAVGKIVSALNQSGQLENTIIFFLSDNGLAWGEHRWTSKKVPYEPSIRVPYVVRYDPLTSHGSVDQNDMVLNIDIAPTIAQLAGAKAPAMDGMSLVPLLDGTAADWRQDFLVEHLSKNRGQAPPTYCAVRSPDYMYVYYATGEEELYSLKQDPQELRNRIDDPNLDIVRTQMRSQLKQLCSPHPPGLHIHGI